MAAFTEQQKTEFSMQKWYDLSGKTAVVTGGITGLGLAITRCLVSAGAKVIALSRTDEKQGNEILKEFGGKAVFYQFDITDIFLAVISGIIHQNINRSLFFLKSWQLLQNSRKQNFLCRNGMIFPEKQQL